MKKLLFILCSFLFYCSCLAGHNDFGYISYSRPNIGDDIQALAAKKFLPKDSIPIDREFVGTFNHQRKVKTIINGWFMHTKDFAWYRTDISAPEKSWPPSPSIDPLLISIHFTNGFMSTALSEESVNYLRQHGPIGARDYHTLRALQKKNIPAYFSGCLTLTLENPFPNAKREDIIYAVDIDEPTLNMLRSRTKSKVKVVSHVNELYTFLSCEQRLQTAEKILEKYAKAKCVITTRLHATMPCLALQTPVLLIAKPGGDRFGGLEELVQTCTRDDFISGNCSYDFDNPPENPKLYLPIRERLIEIVTAWVMKNS